ncbi:hypothetical protein BVC80_1395g85 [Macleaya cordata]|uniref:Uncharacterized protein n=1 Tax=Macleaya cordata TaxID=56857 RepID=A0A200Q1N8_MACCD|nr:hypothetical protein BVC80_1395g85 [Macleaya cordata]
MSWLDFLFGRTMDPEFPETKPELKFTVTRQAQNVAPPDMQCKDRFLIQSMIVPFGTTDKDIPSSMFNKDNEMYIEEKKLRVVLISPRYSPVLLAINGTPKNNEAAPALKDQVLSGLKNLLLPYMVANDMEELKLAKDVEQVIDVEKLQLAKDIGNLKSSLNKMELKLSEFENTIKSLREERSTIIEENNTLKQELVSQQRKKSRMATSLFGFSTCLRGLRRKAEERKKSGAC